jgi:hypothetical protein
MWRDVRLATLATALLAGTAMNALVADPSMGVGDGSEPITGTYGSGGPGSQGNPGSPQGGIGSGVPTTLGNGIPLPGSVPLPGTVSPFSGRPEPRENR